MILHTYVCSKKIHNFNRIGQTVLELVILTKFHNDLATIVDVLLITYFHASLIFVVYTLEFLINVALRLLIFGIFSRGYDLIREGYAYCLWQILFLEFFNGFKEDK